MSANVEALHLRFIEEVWENSNLGIIEEVMAEDIISHSAHGDLRGRAAFTDYIRMWVETMPDQTVDVDESMRIGDTTVLRWSSHGTHAGRAFLGVPPTNRPMTITGLTIAHWVDGRMTEVWFAYDLLTVYQQLTGWDPRDAGNPALVDTLNRYIAALDAGDVATALSFYTDDFQYADLATGLRSEGRDAMDPILRGWFDQIQDLRVEVRSTVVSGTTAVVEWTVTGTAAADFPEPLPHRSGDRVILPYLAIIEFTEQLEIRKETNYVDASVLRQPVS